MAKSKSRRYKDQGWSEQFDDIVRAASGGFLFGIPLIYTMEVWWIGSQINLPMLILIIAVTFVVVFLLNQTEGFRKRRSKDFLDTLMDSVEVLAIGFVCATFILLLLREIKLSSPLNEALGKLIIEGVPFSIGAALSQGVLSGDRWSSSNNQNQEKKETESDLNATLADIGATLIGATIIAFNIAPTDEIPMLNASASPPWLLLIIAASLLVSYGIVFQAGFTSQTKRRQQEGIFQRPFSETIFSYLVSLLAAMFMLFFFNRLTFSDPWTLWLSHTIILGLPATIGGAAGRLAL